MDKGLLQVRRQNLSAYFLKHSRYMRPWMRRLVAEYKARGAFPPLATDIMHAYSDRHDKEIAGFASLAFKDNEDIEKQITDMRQTMGASPWEWFTSRMFATFGADKNESVIAGTRKRKWWMVARLMDALWELCDKKQAEYIEECIPPTIFDRIAHRMMTSAEMGIDFFYAARLLRLALTTDDGIGMGLWKSYPAPIRCPIGKREERFLRTWFPEWWPIMMPADDAIALFELEYDFDFFYAALAWNDLCRTRPLECSRHVTLYQRWWRTNLYKDRREQEKMFVQPPFWG